MLAPLVATATLFIFISLQCPVWATDVKSQALSTGDDAAASSFVVPLKKQRVPIVVNGCTLGDKTAYFGNIYVGAPKAQVFTAVFDTGSAHVFVPSNECADEACKVHNRYARSRSTTYVDINHDGVAADVAPDERDRVAIAYGTGEIVGDFVREQVCLGQPAAPRPNASLHCTRVRLILATEMTQEPFAHFAFDGVMGLGLEALALEAEYHVFGQMAREKMIEPLFGFFLSANDDVDSEITVGRVDHRRFEGDLRWVPVVEPERGYWRVAIRRIRIGDGVLDLCEDGSCSAIVDTGTSALGVPAEAGQEFLYKTSRGLPAPAAAASAADTEADCREVPGPVVTFELEDDFAIVMNAKDYYRGAPMDLEPEDEVPVQDQNVTVGGAAPARVCRASVVPVAMPTLGEKVFIWGEPVLMKYYSSYDWKREQVGFAITRQPDARNLII